MTTPTTQAIRPQLRDVKTALALLTRMPVKARFDRTAQATWAFPLVGLVLGLIFTCITVAAQAIGFGVGISAIMALAASIILTGAMHEDGLADSADGLWGGWEKARRLEIMHDSRIGTYGVLALIAAMILRFSAVSLLLHEHMLTGAFIAAAMMSRAALPYVMTLLPHARQDGLSVQTGRPSRQTASIGAALACALAWFCVGFVGMVVALAVIMLCTAALMAIARAKIGGQTGDILGATQIVTEVAALLAFVAIL